MSKTYLVSGETLKTVALGAITLGAYQQFTFNKMMDLNNEKTNSTNEIIKLEHRREMDKMDSNNEIIKLEHKREMEIYRMQREQFMDKMETQHKREMHELNEKLDTLFNEQKKKNNWW